MEFKQKVWHVEVNLWATSPPRHHVHFFFPQAPTPQRGGKMGGTRGRKSRKRKASSSPRISHTSACAFQFMTLAPCHTFITSQHPLEKLCGVC